MADSWFYLSILKGRRAEYEALAQLAPDVAGRLTPLIQLWPGRDAEEDGAPQLWPEQGEDEVSRTLVKLLGSLRTSWDSERPVLLDGEWLPAAAAYRDVLTACRGAGRRPLPVTGLGRPDAYQGVVAESIAADGQGYVLRLGRDDYPPRRRDLPERIDALLALLGVPPAQVDVVIDLRHIERQTAERDEMLAAAMVNGLPHVTQWRTVALAASAIPADMRAFERNAIEPFPRLEWGLWQRLRDRGAGLVRLPVFADYAVIHPDRVEEVATPRVLPRIVQIRYTAATSGSWCGASTSWSKAQSTCPVCSGSSPVARNGADRSSALGIAGSPTSRRGMERGGHRPCGSGSAPSITGRSSPGSSPACPPDERVTDEGAQLVWRRELGELPPQDPPRRPRKPPEARLKRGRDFVTPEQLRNCDRITAQGSLRHRGPIRSRALPLVLARDPTSRAGVGRPCGGAGPVRQA